MTTVVYSGGEGAIIVADLIDEETVVSADCVVGRIGTATGSHNGYSYL